MKHRDSKHYGKIIACLLAAAFLSMVAACSSEEKPEPTVPQKVSAPATDKTKSGSASDIAKAKPKEQAQPEPVKEYAYDATGKPDPFEPLVAAVEPMKQAQSAVAARPASDKPLTPLQKFDLSDLFLVAIVYADNSSTALVEDNARNGYIVKEGMLIGRNDGVIKKILKNSMIVEEKIADSSGATETKVSTLTIHKKE